MQRDKTGADLLAEARDAALAQGDQETAAEAEAMLGIIAWSQGQGERALEHDRHAVARQGVRGGQPRRFSHATGPFQGAIQVGQQALGMANELRLEELRAWALGYIGSARFSAGDLGGVADLEHAVATCVKANSPNAAVFYSNLAVVLFALGDLSRASQLLEYGRQAAERFGRASDLSGLPGRQIIWDYWKGNWDVAIADANQLIARSQGGPERIHEGSGRLIRAWIRLARGDVLGALDNADTAVQLAQAAMVPKTCTWPSHYEAACCSRPGEPRRLTPRQASRWPCWWNGEYGHGS